MNLRDISNNKPLATLMAGDMVGITAASAAVTNGDHIISTGVLVNNLDQQQATSLNLSDVDATQVCGTKIVTVVNINPFRRKASQELKVEAQMIE